MQYLLTKDFIWEFFIAELMSVGFLTLMSFLCTHYAHKYTKRNFLYPFFYACATLTAALISFAVLRILAQIFEPDKFDEINNNIPPIVNPMVTLFYVFTYAFNPIKTQIHIANIWLIILGHIIGGTLGGLIWVRIKRNKKYLNNSYKNVKDIKPKELLWDSGFIFSFTLLTFIIQYIINHKTNNYILSSTYTGGLTLCMLLSASWMLRFSFPTNIYVSGGSFIVSYYYNKSKRKTNALYLMFVALVYIVSTAIVSYIYIILPISHNSALFIH
ncbi:hypothetical protein [Mycoplasmopsis verecunda]|uniref:Uncharacterized protein n=1 Tax=Mycoplasmopsis verecunda TaxID=171291 RepID=A0A1T4KFZ2_9BACT|nr:hypothetical protein [Mycoplasmopsis verecunda]WPB54899.1 hypothetical protein SAM46_01945 [Mycoplasmopsis verecunda]SJZ41342.1 hypothetical protein SAMN02745154_00047 [Mycoplasmopsis verecunda]